MSSRAKMSPPNDPSQVTVILVNFNSSDLLKNCLESLSRHAPKVTYEIIVVDNASTEKKIETIQSDFSDIQLVFLDQNVGFAGANNIASRLASGEVLLFLNPDTRIENDVVDAVYGLSRRPNAGCIGPRLLTPDGELQKDSARKFPTLASSFCNIFLLKRLLGRFPVFSEYIDDYTRSQEVDVVIGACLGIRSALFSQVGGFSEDYFLYTEDVDLCYRVQHLGGVNYYLADKPVIHYGGGSAHRTPGAKVFESQLFKSRRIFFRNKTKREFFLLNVIYIAGGAFRMLICGLMIASGLITADRMRIIRSWNTLVKYWKVLLLGLGIDTIPSPGASRSDTTGK